MQINTTLAIDNPFEEENLVTVELTGTFERGRSDNPHESTWDLVGWNAYWWKNGKRAELDLNANEQATAIQRLYDEMRGA